VIAPAHVEHAWCTRSATRRVSARRFIPSERLSARKSWIAFAVASRGRCTSIRARCRRSSTTVGASCAWRGVTRGKLRRGDAVEIKGPDGQVVAKGLVRVSAESFHESDDVVVHRDDLVSFGEPDGTVTIAHVDRSADGAGPRGREAATAWVRPRTSSAAPYCCTWPTDSKRPARNCSRSTRPTSRPTKNPRRRRRLTLTDARVEAMADTLREIANTRSALESVDQSVRPNGLRVERLRVPLGVIGVVYENRPNVTSDVADSACEVATPPTFADRPRVRHESVHRLALARRLEKKVCPRRACHWCRTRHTRRPPRSCK